MDERLKYHLERIESLLTAHDWFYDRSDDYRCYVQGHASLMEIQSLGSIILTTDSQHSPEASEELYKICQKYLDMDGASVPHWFNQFKNKRRAVGTTMTLHSFENQKQ